MSYDDDDDDDPLRMARGIGFTILLWVDVAVAVWLAVILWRLFR